MYCMYMERNTSLKEVDKIFETIIILFQSTQAYTYHLNHLNILSSTNIYMFDVPINFPILSI